LIVFQKKIYIYLQQQIYNKRFKGCQLFESWQPLKR
jgi:hypothetical protein